MSFPFEYKIVQTHSIYVLNVISFSPQSDVTTSSGIGSLSSFSPTDQSTDEIDKVVYVTLALDY